MRDVDYALMAQLAYLNWNKINKKGKLTDIFNSNKKYSTKDSEYFMNFFDFSDWEVLYSANKKRLYKDYYNIDIEFDDGFFGVVFMRDEDVMIAYRGTEPIKLNDIFTDLELGLFKKNSSQLLSAIIFYEYIRKKLKNKNFYITGHSLGGCLAQYVYLYSQKKATTRTWNALGIGRDKEKLNKNFLLSDDITNYVNIGSKEISNKIKELYIKENGTVDEKFLNYGEISLIDEINNIISAISLKTIDSGFNEIYSKNINNFKVSFGVKLPKENFNKENMGRVNREFRIASIQIYWLLKGIKSIQEARKLDYTNIINYYNKKDWTANLQTREGKIVEVITGDTTLQEIDDDTLKRAIKTTFDKFGFKYHGVNNFLLYMNNNGNIEAGRINEKYIENN